MAEITYCVKIEDAETNAILRDGLQAMKRHINRHGQPIDRHGNAYEATPKVFDALNYYGVTYFTDADLDEGMWYMNAIRESMPTSKKKWIGLCYRYLSTIADMRADSLRRQIEDTAKTLAVPMPTSDNYILVWQEERRHDTDSNFMAGWSVGLHFVADPTKIDSIDFSRSYGTELIDWRVKPGVSGDKAQARAIGYSIKDEPVDYIPTFRVERGFGGNDPKVFDTLTEAKAHIDRLVADALEHFRPQHLAGWQERHLEATDQQRVLVARLEGMTRSEAA